MKMSQGNLLKIHLGRTDLDPQKGFKLPNVHTTLIVKLECLKPDHSRVRKLSDEVRGRVDLLYSDVFRMFLRKIVESIPGVFLE